MTFLTAFLVFVTTILVTVYLWFKFQYSYWKRKNIPFYPPKFLTGSLQDIVLFRESAADGLAKIYFDQKFDNEPIVGIHAFHKPGLLIKDLELIKMMLVKDFNKFTNRYSNSDPNSDVIGQHMLFFVKNPSWKQICTNMTPFFSSGKLKQMFHLVNDIGTQLDNYISSICGDPEVKGKCQDIKEIASLYTTDVIVSVALGVEANSLKNPEGEFRKNGKKVFDFNLYRAFEFNSFFFIPQIVSLFNFHVFSKEAKQFLRTTIHHIIGEREKSGAVRNDLIDLLISLKSSSQSDTNKNLVKYENDVLVAQAGTFFVAGFETTSSTIAFCIYELAKRQDIQNRLRTEIKDTLEKNNGQLTYDALNSMEYLGMVLQETLRLYPPLPFLDRECVLSKNEKGYSLKPITDFEIPNGMPLYIPIYAIHRDPKYFPDPDVFDPERFSTENKKNIQPYSYIPFGTGPRNCIGERLGVMQTKIGLIHFLRNHYVRPSYKSQEVMKLEKKALMIQAEGGIHCDIIKDPLFREI